MKNCTPVIIGWLLFGLSLVAFQAVQAQESDKVVTGKLRLPGGEEVKFSAADGDIVVVRDEVANYRVGFLVSPLPSGATVRFHAFNINEIAGEDELSSLGGVVVGTGKGWGKIQIAEMLFALSVREVRSCRSDIKQGFASESAVPPGEFTDSGVCCVSCGAITVCGGSVTTSCGSCDGSGGRLAV